MLHDLERFGAILGLADDIHLRVERQEHAQSLPDHLMVVCNHDAYRHWSSPPKVGDRVSTNAAGAGSPAARTTVSGLITERNNFAGPKRGTKRTDIKVLLVDDQAAARMGLKLRLGLETDLEVLGEAVDGIDAVAQATRLVRTSW